MGNFPYLKSKFLDFDIFKHIGIQSCLKITINQLNISVLASILTKILDYTTLLITHKNTTPSFPDICNKVLTSASGALNTATYKPKFVSGFFIGSQLMHWIHNPWIPAPDPVCPLCVPTTNDQSSVPLDINKVTV